MAFKTSDTDLIGYWPMNEASGTPIIKNYASLAASNSRSSGVTFDFTLHVTDSDSNSESTWPGTTSFNTPSGTIQGLQLIGSGWMGADVSSLSFSRNVWMLGNGGDSSRLAITTPSIANSGFTIGGWIYPNSNGNQHPVMLRDRLAALALRHALVSKFDPTTGSAIPTNGFVIGVSGQLVFGAQNPQLDPNNADGTLRLFAHVGNTTEGTHKHLATPIESGKYTHFTFTYQFIDGTSNQIKLYKDGNLEASTVTTSELDLSNANYSKRPLTLGGTESFTATNAALDYTWSAGHNHLISGLYFFDRPLLASEIGIINGGGGITIDTFATGSGRPISIQDSSLLGYYEFGGKGFGDSCLKRNHLISNFDSLNGHIVSIPGPFNNHAAWNDGGSTVTPLIATSGVTQLLRNVSWTIAGWFFAAAPGTQGHLWSIGAESNTTNRFASLDFQTTGRVPRFTLYRDGTSTGTVARLIPSGSSNLFDRTWFHAACVYDHRPGTESPYNAFIFINGEQRASGNLGSALATTAIDAGFPLTILGATSTGPITFDATKGDANACANVAIFNRALDPFEIRGLAQSGIDTTPLLLTPYDPRLRGYWRCDEPSGAPMILDYAVYGSSGNYSAGLKGHLVPYINSLMIDNAFGSTSAQSNKNIDFLNNLIDANGRGITSGVWVPLGHSCGVNQGTSPNLHDSAQNLSYRFLLSQDGKTVREPPFNHDLAIYFEVTPSGSIPRTFNGIEPGSALISCGADTGVVSTNDGWNIYLTDCNRGGPASTSGTAVVFETRTTTNIHTLLVSGNIPVNQTSKVLIRTKSFHDDRNATNKDNNQTQVDLWINGELIQRQQYDQNSANITPTSATNLYKLAFGLHSSLFGATPTVDTHHYGGLGQNALRQIAIFNGTLNHYETVTLATSGLTSAAGFPTPQSQMPMTSVTLKDANLEGYWRFSDPVNNSNSGLDLSFKHNNLQMFIPDSAQSQNSLRLLKTIRGPYLGYSNNPVEASGMGYPQVPTAISFPPFVVSGVGIQSPQNSFSVGMRILVNATPPNTNASVVLAYGPYSQQSNVPQDTSWYIAVQKTALNVYMGISSDGGVNDSNTFATASGQVVVGTNCKHNTSIGYPLSRLGYVESVAFQSYNQYTFTYNSLTTAVKAYLNGELIDQMFVPIFHTPAIPENRMLSFLVPATGQPTPWTWNAPARSATDLVLTDVFYFSRALADAEVRYIAASGISQVTMTSTSGIVGGFAYGYGITSGVVGAYTEGLQPVSSGLAGGYILGFASPSGSIGGYTTAMGQSSGTFGGWLRAVGVSSGILGGFINGGLSGIDNFDAWFTIDGISNQDFDAQIEIQRVSFYDFDAQVELFQDELGALTVIQYPEHHLSGILAPFLLWIVGSGVPVQGKTLNRITYNFGDFTPTVNATPSGNHQFVSTHRYPGSGLYNVLFKTVDSDGVVGSDFRIINLASGMPLPSVELTATPRSGPAPLRVQFTTNITNLPPGVNIISQLLDFGNGVSTIRSNPAYVYTDIGNFIPRLIVLDDRGVVTTDSLLIGVDY